MSEEALAIQTLSSICGDPDAPATARASAARTLLELAGLIGRLQVEKPNSNKALHELSLDELDREILARQVTSPPASVPDSVDTGHVTVDTVHREVTPSITPRRRPGRRSKRRPKMAAGAVDSAAAVDSERTLGSVVDSVDSLDWL